MSKDGQGSAMTGRSIRTKSPGIYRTPATRNFPEGGWEVRYRDAENRTRRTTFRTKQEGSAFKAAVATDKHRGDYQDPRKATTRFRDVADQWFDGTAHLRPTTRAGYESMLRTYIKPRLGDYQVGRISPSVLRAFISGLPGEMSPARKRHIFRTLVPIFSLAVDDGLIRTSPTHAKTVRQALPKVHRKDMDFLTPEQVDALAHAITPRYRTLVYFAAYTGMRAGEIAGLRVGDVDLKASLVRVRESVSDVNGHLDFGPPKNGKPREIGIPPFLVQLLTEQMGERRANRKAFVFPGTGDQPMRHSNFYARHFKPAVRRALSSELHSLRFHDLRHTCAALCIANGEHPKAVQERLGHSSIAITMDRYGKLYKDQERALVGRLQDTYLKAVDAARAENAQVVELSGLVAE